MELDARLGIPVSPSVGPMQASLRGGDGIEYATAFLPAFQGKEMKLEARARITNESAFDLFTRQLLHDSSIDVIMTGQTTSVVFGRNTSVSFNKRIKVSAMSGPRINIKSISMGQGASPLTTIAEVNNPSPFEVELGNTTFGAFYNDIKISTVSGPVKLQRGTTTLEQHGTLDVAALASRPDLMSKFTAEAQADGVHAILKGLENENAIPWILRAVKELQQPVVLPIKGL